MRLPRPFYRLPVRFDVARLQHEVAAFPTDAWVDHPKGLAGNSALRLITADGGQNDAVDGVMQATPYLAQSPYLRQVLASLGVVWSRSRLMRLAPGAEVAEHADINYHWHYRIRIHIPIVTNPAVHFRCGDTTVHMAPGEAWIFDNWRRHSVTNGGDAARIHLVADSAGSSAFWRFVTAGQAGNVPGGVADRSHRYDPAQDRLEPLMERTRLAPVMAPAEVDLLVLDLRSELTPEDPLAPRHGLEPYLALLDAFRYDWRQLYSLYGDDAAGWPQYRGLRGRLREASRKLGEGLCMRTNQIGAHPVLEGRLLRALLPAMPDEPAPDAPVSGRAPLPGPLRPRRPVFIIAAPRSGSTLLFETLASSRELVTLGGEAHWLVEDLTALRPGAAGVESNRLEARQVTENVADHILKTIAARLRDADDAPTALRPDSRLLEKTPKNALRIPFWNQLFPDAQFIFLWRDPHENLSSIIEAWRSGRWKTYNGLDGFDGPWSLLLPPGWRGMRGRPLEEIAAFQWASANRLALDDLTALPAARWTTVHYTRFLANPAAETRRLCAFLGIGVDSALAARLAGPLPLSRYTQTAPDPLKWRHNAALIERVMPGLETLWERLRGLG